MTPQRQLEHRVDSLSHPIGFGRIVDETADKLLRLGPVRTQPGLDYKSTGGVSLFDAYKQWSAIEDARFAFKHELQQYGNEFGAAVLTFAQSVADEHDMRIYGDINLCVTGAIPAPRSHVDFERYTGLCTMYGVKPFSRTVLTGKDHFISSFDGRPAEVILELEEGYKGDVSQMMKFFRELPVPMHMHYARLAVADQSEHGYLLEANMNEIRLSPLTVNVAPTVYEMFRSIPAQPRKEAA